MALPKGNESYEKYTDQLVYFGARLAADPRTAKVAPSVDAVLEQVDEAHARLRQTRRNEVRARALRDHIDELGDRQVRRYRRQVGVLEGVAFVVDRLFLRGISYLTAPRGRAQLERLAKLRVTTQDLLASKQVEVHPDAEELRKTLELGDVMIGEAIEDLEGAVSDWEARTVELARARDLVRFRRSNGVAQLGVVMGELRALLGGDARAAYAYTASARRKGASIDEDELLEEIEIEDQIDAELEALG